MPLKWLFDRDIDRWFMRFAGIISTLVFLLMIHDLVAGSMKEFHLQPLEAVYWVLTSLLLILLLCTIVYAYLLGLTERLDRLIKIVVDPVMNKFKENEQAKIKAFTLNL
jgi:hypothetical protein